MNPGDEKKGDLTGASKKDVRVLVATMTLFVVVPPLLTAIVEGVTGWEFPAWFRDTLFILILCVEGMIFYWTSKMAYLMIEAENAYTQILALAEKVKQPLENIGKLLYNMADLLPVIEKIFASIPKDKAKLALENIAHQIELEKNKPSREELAEIAAQMKGVSPSPNQDGGSSSTQKPAPPQH